MAYQRAQWSSGLTYAQICPTCKREVRYTDTVLDFRPWYADGYVDCPVCKTHLRHNEEYAINAPVSAPAKNTGAQATADFTEDYCGKCGNKFGEGHRFCGKCGTKRA